jgi:hypothetical protein
MTQHIKLRLHVITNACINLYDCRDAPLLVGDEHAQLGEHPFVETFAPTSGDEHPSICSGPWCLTIIDCRADEAGFPSAGTHDLFGHALMCRLFSSFSFLGKVDPPSPAE